MSGQSEKVLACVAMYGVEFTAQLLELSVQTVKWYVSRERTKHKRVRRADRSGICPLPSYSFAKRQDDEAIREVYAELISQKVGIVGVRLA